MHFNNKFMVDLRKRRTALLATPNKRNVTKKFDPTTADKVKHFCKLPVKHPVEPLPNKRLHMLAETPSFKKTQKWEEPDLPSTCISRTILEAACTARLDHLSRHPPRFLRAVKEERRYLGSQFMDMMDEQIHNALSTIYYHNVKSVMDIELQKNKRMKMEQKPKYWEECGDKGRMEQLAKAKPTPKGRAPRPRKHMTLELLKPRIDELSVPLHRNKRSSSEDSIVKRFQVKPEALTYVPTVRILELTKIPAWRLVKPWVPTGVSKAAKRYEITDRITKLAVPHTRAQQQENDLKENPYDISPAALKYNASPRILDLAKPRQG